MITVLLLLTLNKQIVIMDEEQNMIDDFIAQLKSKKNELFTPQSMEDYHSPVLYPEADNTNVQKPPVNNKVDKNNLETPQKESIVDYKINEIPKANPVIFKTTGNDELLNGLNKFSPNRFNPRNSTVYDQYDNQILSATQELKAEGENVQPKLIKAIMLVETGMRPRQNRKGYYGFPQTSDANLTYINKKYNTNFSKLDMYNAKKATKFIHYYLKDVMRSSYINNYQDAIAAYNWGIGNYIKFKEGRKVMPDETKNYISLVDTIMNYNFNTKTFKTN